ncbi:hypothetical protein GCM10010405_17890 [Streptomyces macrosporus]|uniref:CBS domain-containing protein n=1 Tax=Streptomyces macrosporus TaxID=44032 RepID=A0ABP5WSL6_9ACTN
MEQVRHPQEQARAGAVTAGESTTAPAVCVRAGATLAEAARIMARRRVKRLPVVDAGGALVGVVGRGDLLRVFLRPDEDIAREVHREVSVPLFPDGEVGVRVSEGVVVFTRRVRDTALVPVAARMARAVEGSWTSGSTSSAPPFRSAVRRRPWRARRPEPALPRPAGPAVPPAPLRGVPEHAGDGPFGPGVGRTPEGTIGGRGRVRPDRRREGTV